VESAGPILFVVLMLAGAGVGIYSNRLSNGRRKGRATFLAKSLCGAALCAMGLLNLAGIHTSGRSSFTGVIGSLRQSHGRSSSSSFHVLDSNRQWRYVHCDYAGDHLVNGETVAVELLDFHSTLLRLTILDGRNSGWSLTEGDGTISCTFEIGLGLFIVLAAKTKWRRDPEDVEEHNDGRIPKNGVDSESLMHLSSRTEEDS
jgi:hypothetical protein